MENQLVKLFQTHLDYSIFCVSIILALALIHILIWKIKKVRLISTWLLAFVVLVITIGWGWVDRQEVDVRNYHRNRLSGFAPTYALIMQELGHHRLSLNTPPDDPLYLQIIELEKSIISVNPAIADVYTFKKNAEGKIVFMVDSETDYDHSGEYSGDREQRTTIGEVYDKVGAELEEAFTGKASFMANTYTDRWGNWISAFVPLRSPDGKVDGVLGVDYPAEDLLKDIAFVRRTYIFYLAGLLIIILIFAAAYQLLRAELKVRKQTEEALVNSQMAQIRGAKLSALGEMAGGIAHEINNPLAIIVGRISQVRRKVETGKIETQSLVESLTKVEDTAMRIAKIIKGLRSFSRDAGKDPMEKMKIPSVVEDALELCRERFRNHNIELRVSLGDSQEIYALGRPTQITQVLVNLLGNAFDATEGLPEKWVALDLIRSGKNVQLRVTDSGKGIPLEVAEKIMQPFFTTKPVGKGTGLGLSISKGIIEEHHGRLFYDSSSPNTRFVIELPCFQSPTQVVA